MLPRRTLEATEMNFSLGLESAVQVPVLDNTLASCVLPHLLLYTRSFGCNILPWSALLKV
jgi:hypothetical protein